MIDNKKPSEDVSIEAITSEVPTWEEIETEIAGEIDEAIKFQKKFIIPTRMINWDRYYGKAFGNEIRGRSKYMSRDLLETVEWILPNLIKLFGSSDQKIQLEIYNEFSTGQNEVPILPLTPKQLGKALMDNIYEDFYVDEANGIFNIFYTWFKDALVSGSAYTKLFWETDTDIESIDTVVDEEGFNELSVLPDVTLNTAVLNPDGSVSVTGERERISKDLLVCDNIPHWEFIFEEHTRTMNDDSGKGFSTIVTLDFLKRINRAFSTEEEPFFHNLDVLELSSSRLDWSRYDDKAEQNQYFGFEVLNEYAGAAKKGGKRRIQLTEWNAQLDVNGDGFLEDIKVWRANEQMIRWEINNEHFIPYCGISPIGNPYKFQGLAYADLIIELQELKSMLMRKILDNFDLQNAGRWFIKPNTAIDEARFLQNVPGDLFTVDPEKIKNLAPQGFDSSSLNLLEYIEGIKENRTGSTRYNQGTDASTLNQTAHGIQSILSASMKRIELIGTLFAEGGIKDLFRKAALLKQRNLKQPFTTKINGETVEITPEMIQGRIVAKARLGTEDQVGQIESQKLLQMSAVLFDLNTKFPGLITPEKARNIAAKYIECMGYESDTYLSSSIEFTESVNKAQQVQETMQQMAMMMEQLKMQIEQEGVAIEKIAAYGAIAEAQAALKVKLAIEDAKLRQKEGESLRSQKIDLFGQIYQQIAPSTIATQSSKTEPMQ